MPINTVIALASLAYTKPFLGIASGDTSQDSFVGDLINASSVQIETYLGYSFARQVITGETYAPVERQLVVLREWPVISVQQVVGPDGLLTAGSDYFFQTQDAPRGTIFAPFGWSGNYAVGGLTLDTMAGLRDYAIDYTCGYYLPGDGSYSAGDPASLPLDISMCCAKMVSKQFFIVRRQMEGLESASEGGLSYRGHRPIRGSGYEDSTGIDPEHVALLRPYKRLTVA